MNSSKDFDFFDNDDDEEFFNLPTTKDSSCSSRPHHTVFTTKLEKQNRNQANISVSNKLTNFLCKFNFKPKDDEGDDTAAKLIVENREENGATEIINGDLKNDNSQLLSQDSSDFRPKVNDVEKSMHLVSSVVPSKKKQDLISPMDEMSFDVFFDDCDADSFLNEPCETDIKTKQSNDICKNSPLTLRHLPSSPIVLHETASTNEDINFKSKSVNNCVVNVVFDDSDADSFFNEPCETDIKTKQSNDICKNSLLTFRDLPSSPIVPYETASTDKDISFKSKNVNNCVKSTLVENFLIGCTSTPCTAVSVKKSQFLKNGDLPFDKENDMSGISFSKSHAVNKLFGTKELLSTSSHKSRKRKFPGPAGLLPDLPPESPVSFKPYEHMLKLDILDSSYEQDLCSQSDTDDFLSLPWGTMISDVSNHVDISLLKHFNIKSIQKQASKKKLPKYVEAPILCVLLKSITCKDSEVVAVFKDETGEISGKIYHEVMEEYKELLKPGSVIVLKKVVYLLNQLSVKAANIVRIYDSNGSIADVSDWNDIKPVSCKKQPGNTNMNTAKDFNENEREFREEISEKENFSFKDVCIQKKESGDYIVDIMDENLFTDDFDELILSMDDQSFIM